MALAGEGVAWLPRSAIGAELAAGRLVSCAHPTDYDLAVEIRAYRRAERERSIVEHVWRAVTELPKDHAISA